MQTLTSIGDVGGLSEWPVCRCHFFFLSASLYFSKRGAYWDRLCRDVVGWLSPPWGDP